MQINKAEFIKSVADKSCFMEFDKPVLCVTGRSNVGKSSFINMLAGRKKLAKTSVTPGRTRLINYFDFGDFILVDLPGYGYASVSKAEKDKWARTMEDYFHMSHIDHVFSLVDIRHDPTNDDKDMIKFLYSTIIPFTVITTKADKLSKQQRAKSLKNISTLLSLGTENIIMTDYSGFGKDEVLKKLDSIVEVFYNKELVAEDEENQENDN